MIWRGFRFGMMLQLAVGPICLLTFMAAASFGWAAGEAVAVAAALVDAAYIAVSAGSIAALMQRPQVQQRVRWFGMAVLVGFGLYMMWGALQGSMPKVAFSGTGPMDFFIEGLILTVSNPLTILFWGGVFAAQAAQYHMERRQMGQFAGGCVLSTIVFLSAVAWAGMVLGRFLPDSVLLVLNGAVGMALVYFGVRLCRN